jgi:hypothetical protein
MKKTFNSRERERAKTTSRSGGLLVCEKEKPNLVYVKPG